MTFWKTVGAYLTGWIMAQAAYGLVTRRARKRLWEAEKEDIRDRVADEVEARLGLYLKVQRRRSESTDLEEEGMRTVGEWTP